MPLAAHDLLAFIDASPSPWHAVASATERLTAAGFVGLEEKDAWTIVPGGKYFVQRGGSSLLAFVVGSRNLLETGLRMVGAHTDSPGLRLRPHAPHSQDGLVRLGVEIYGGPILATFTDRDLSLAGRVHVRTAQGIEARLLRFDEALVRLPNLAIHMNREVNESGLKLHKQNELPLLLGLPQAGQDADSQFRALLAERLDLEPDRILTWELAAYDTQPGAFWGAQQEFIAARQLDNLASCHAALSALLATAAPHATCVVALFDHEEVGSESAAGAGGNFAASVVQRLTRALGMDDEDQQRALAQSLFISADMAHAWHPNFPAAYEPCHRVMVNGGPVIKRNANQRYSSDGDTAARFMAICDTAGVPCQHYSHRSDLGCGSTIGPLVAARLGVPSVDVGSPMWAMHSLRESAGALDQDYMIRALGAAFASKD